jgi:hypothetical protein
MAPQSARELYLYGLRSMMEREAAIDKRLDHPSRCAHIGADEGHV